MSEENLIHVKINQNELVPAKRSVLSIESNLIRVIQKVKKYNSLRLKELRLKASLLRRLKETTKGIVNLEGALPHPDMPKILKEKPKPKSKKRKDNLETQLEQIQRKLKELER